MSSGFNFLESYPTAFICTVCFYLIFASRKIQMSNMRKVYEYLKMSLPLFCGMILRFYGEFLPEENLDFFKYTWAGFSIMALMVSLWWIGLLVSGKKVFNYANLKFGK